MARFQVDIEKRLGSEFWTNVWQVSATDLAGATVVANAITAAERIGHSSAVTFTRHRVSSVAIGDGVYAITPIGLPGLATTGELLPLFNTLRMDLTAASGRPSRKYFRGCLGEGLISGDAVTTSVFLTMSLEIADIFSPGAEQSGIVDPQGELFNGIVIHPFVQMRQLRRSRRRRQNGTGVFQ